MKKLLTAVSLTIAAIGFSALANAWEPADTVVVVENDGLITVSKGITLMCSMVGTITVATDGSAGMTSLALSGTGGPPNSFCGALVFTELPYNVAADPSGGNAIVFEGVTVKGITGDCKGNLAGTINRATGVINFDEAEIPADPVTLPLGDPCVIEGDVTTTPPLS